MRPHPRQSRDLQWSLAALDEAPARSWEPPRHATLLTAQNPQLHPPIQRFLKTAVPPPIRRETNPPPTSAGAAGRPGGTGPPRDRRFLAQSTYRRGVP